MLFHSPYCDGCRILFRSIKVSNLLYVSFSRTQFVLERNEIDDRAAVDVLDALSCNVVDSNLQKKCTPFYKNT